MAAYLPIFLPLIIFITLGDIQAHVLRYDRGFTHECREKPLKPLYKGGIVVNSELKQGLKGWGTQVGDAKLKHRTSNDGNNYIAATVDANRSTSTIQEFYLEAEKFYAFSAWLQVSGGNASHINGGFKLQTEDVRVAGWVSAQQGCWSMLKGGIVVNVSVPAQLFFQSDVPISEIWVTSVSLQPFTSKEWKFHQDQSIEKVRKRSVKFQVTDECGQPVVNTTISIKQTQPQFPFGNVLNKLILEYPAYEKWFTSRFRYTVFENELKWNTTELVQGFVNYTSADALLNFTKSHGLIARGHTILWDHKRNNPAWVVNLTGEELWEALNSRVDSVLNRYKEQFIHWDVMNENVHFRFFEDLLGENASTFFYNKTHKKDPKTLLFLNDYFTLAKPEDPLASPWKYLQRIRELRRQGYEGHLGIGLQGHFGEVNLPYMRASLDAMHSAKLPIWITEMDVSKKIVGPLRQVEILEQVLRELHAHEAVQGIIMWSGWSPQGCFQMCLTDENFKNLPTGDVVDKLIAEWTYPSGVQGTTNANGCFETSLHYGEYEATISHPNLPSSNSDLQKFEVVPRNEAAQHMVRFKISA